MAKRSPIIRAFLGDQVVADNFAGGGGASTGIELALGRSPDIAVNHDEEAIAMHAANHPTTTHYRESVWEVDPRKAAGGKRVALAWFSPDCKHHSKAKGGKPREQKIRGLAWVAVTWAHRVRPGVIFLENVEEFREWGPLHRVHTHGCMGAPRERRIKGRSRMTQGCRKGCQFGKPIKERKGETFRAFVRKLEKLGYTVEHRLLRACDYGAPTRRRRLFLIARCDGRPVRWPAPTHAPIKRADQPADSPFVDVVKLQPYRTAADCIDWSIPCPSIFDRKRPLAPKTEARIARGIKKFVLGSSKPFIVPVNHGGVGRKDHRVHDIAEPMPTITGGQRGGHALVTPIVTKFQQNSNGQPVDEPLDTVMAGATRFALVAPYLVHRSNGERPGQAPRIYDVQEPLGTIVAQGQKHALVTPILEKPDKVAAFLAKHYGGNESSSGGTAITDPVDTITAQDHHSLVAAHLVRYNGDRREGEVRGADVSEPLPTQDTSNRFGLIASHLIKLQGTSDAHLTASAESLEEPMPTLTAQGWKVAQVAAFLVKYYGAEVGQYQAADQPLDTVTTKPRFGLITVTIDGEQYVVVDIGMRMLTPRELFRAQGFSDDYDIAPVVEVKGKRKQLSKTAQIRMCGNSVPPPIVEALVRSNLLDDVAEAA